MRARAVAVLGTAGVILGLGAGAAQAQVSGTSTMAVPVIVAQQVGPTRLYAVPRAQVLGLGDNLVSANLFLGGVGIGATPVGVGINNVMGNALNLRADMGMGENFELGTGIGIISSAPWRGRLDVSGKWALLREGPAIASIAGLMGGVLEVDANGNPSLGLQFGLPVTKLFAFNSVNALGLTLVPNWNLGLLNTAGAFSPTGGPFNFFGLGLGADFTAMRDLHVLVDTNVGLPVAGINTTSTNLGIRYAFSRAWTGDLFLGIARGAPGLAGGNASLGVGSTWAF